MTVPVEEALELLRRFDDPRYAERPDGFDERAAAACFEELVARLGEAFSCDVATESWPRIGDCSYYGQASIGSTETGGDIQVMVSNFGNLALYALDYPGAYSDAEREVLMSGRDRDRVETALAESGYVALPEDVLRQPYDGANRWLIADYYARRKSPATWFARYFGWI